jgi:hypothetical protein
MEARSSEFEFSRRIMSFACFLYSASSLSLCSSSTEAANGSPSDTLAMVVERIMKDVKFRIDVLKHSQQI